MTLALDVHSLVVDLDQVLLLHDQLAGLPVEVQQLFEHVKRTQSQLASLEQRVPTGDTDVSNAQPFKDFRRRLLDLELFVDPQQQLPRSGPGSDIKQGVQWGVTDSSYVQTFCQTFAG